MVLEQGALSGKYNKENPMPAESDRGKKYNPVLPQLEALTDAMTAIGERHGASCSQIGIAWAIAKGTLPIIGATKERNVVEAADRMGPEGIPPLLMDMFRILEELSGDPEL